jgi:hypothetical protein
MGTLIDCPMAAENSPTARLQMKGPTPFWRQRAPRHAPSTGAQGYSAAGYRSEQIKGPGLVTKWVVDPLGAPPDRC